jgi:hypothetical protein
MLFQTDSVFPEWVQKKGCYLFTILRMCELVAGKEFTSSEINDIYIYGLSSLSITSVDGVVNPDRVCKKALKVLGDEVHYITQVGKKSIDGSIKYWPWVQIHEAYKTVGYLALRFATSHGHHYILGDRLNNILFDPYEKPYTRLQLLDALVHNVQ